MLNALHDPVIMDFNIPILQTRKLAQEIKKYAQDHTARKSLANCDTLISSNQKNSPKTQAFGQKKF